MKVIGLIGGCGTGKSEVAKVVNNRYNAYVLTADHIGHELLEKGTESYCKIIQHFGNKILDNDSEINRKLLGDIVFTNDDELEILNSYTHPYMYAKLKAKINEIKETKKYDLIVLEAAVMIEAHFIDFTDQVWLITCPLKKRIDRLMRYRNMSLEKIEQIISKQRSEESYRKYAHTVIDNGFDVSQTSLQIQNEIDKLLEEDHE